jgi:tRNA uracil 4-sulfurtransferase
MLSLIIHYDEIGLKGGNRLFFEKKLVETLKAKAARHGLSKNIRRLYGRYYVEIKPENQTTWEQIVSSTFGVSNFSIGLPCKQDIAEISQIAITLLGKESGETFRIETKRSDKNFALKSQQINEQVGHAVIMALHKKVKLKNPDMTCYVEIVDGRAFVYTKKISGPGGLPIGSSGKAIVLASGGIDSPVAAWYAAKRGLRPIFLHFHSYPYTTDASIEKVTQLIKILATYTNEYTVYMCPFVDIQKHIVMHAPEAYRIILYRRCMIRIAEKLAWKRKAKALVTGESLGQVASQTIDNMRSISAVTTLPIIRPLIGFDKKEIIEKAKKINTFETAILPHDDCCTVFMPKKPETYSKLEIVEEIEKKLDLDDLVRDAMRAMTKQAIA